MKKKENIKIYKIIGILASFIIFNIFFFIPNSYGNCNSSGICIFAFNSSQTWNVPSGITQIDILLVAGGGGGGANTAFNNAGGGGGGAGGLIYKENVSLILSSYDIIVGAGGAGINQEGNPADNGGNTNAFNFTAIGGGGGILTSGTNNAPASNGGSGGGGRQNPAGQGIQASSVWGGFGNNGARNSNDLGGGGGGGAGSAAPNISGDDGGTGGAGLYFGDIFGNQFGDNGWFAGGGGGGGRAGIFGIGGIGGGGNGSSARDGIVPRNGMPNTGGGGGGGGSSHVGANGGSGIVIIKFRDNISPNIEINNPINQNYNIQTHLLNINAFDNIELDSIWYNWNGTNITYINPINISYNSDGEYFIFAWANDTAGNINTTNLTFTIDTIAPNITIISPENIIYDSLTVLLNISTIDTNLQTIWYNWNGTNITYINPINISYNSGGEYTIFTWANDTAGNINFTSINFTLTDNPIKNITLISPQNNQKVLASNQIELIWNTTNILNQILDCQIFVNFVNIVNQSCESNINNSFILNVSRGNYNWFINASNNAGFYFISNIQNFTIIEEKHLKISKLIQNENKDVFIIKTNIENFANRTSNFKIFDFIHTSLNAGSFTPHFNFTNIISGTNYDGNIYEWELNLSALSQNQINYLVTKNINYWQISKSYLIGFE